MLQVALLVLVLVLVPVIVQSIAFESAYSNFYIMLYHFYIAFILFHIIVARSPNRVRCTCHKAGAFSLLYESCVASVLNYVLLGKHPKYLAVS